MPLLRTGRGYILKDGTAPCGAAIQRRIDTMRIAVTCDESGAMSGYFGKSTLLYLAEAEAGRIVARNSRPLGPDGLNAANLHELLDCDSVVCKGIGPGSAEALRARGITPYVVDRPMEPDEAVLALLKGRLKPSGTYAAGGSVS